MDGKTILTGFFGSVLGQPRNNIARINADGTLDTAFNPNANNEVDTITILPDGKIIIGGFFTTVGGTGRIGIARLTADGTLDPAFNLNVNSTVRSVALQPDGKILLGGDFTSIGGIVRNRLARVAADGTLDLNFNPNVERGDILNMAVQADGRIVLGGRFSRVGGQQRERIARIAADGTLDAGFNPGASGTVRCVALQPDGRILLAGEFTSFRSGTGPRYIARLNADGTVDHSFNAGADRYVRSVSLQTDGRILFGGDFASVRGQPRSRIARINSNSTLDTGFNPNPNANANFVGLVYSVTVRADGNVLLGGGFSTMGGTPRFNFAMLLNDPASQDLKAADSSQVHWSREGSSPEVSQTTFELSTDGGISYTPLPGNVNRIGSTANWQLTGLSLPASGHLRARGRTSGGYTRGGSFLIESVTSFGTGSLPTVMAISPGSGSTTGGDRVTITGSHLSGTTAVTIGGMPASGVIVLNATTINAITPARGAGAADVRVATPGGTSAPGISYAYAAPTVTPNAANRVSTAARLTITGNNFSNTPGKNSIRFTPSGSGTVTAATATSLSISNVSGLMLGPLHAVVHTDGLSSGAAVPVATIISPGLGDLDLLDIYMEGRGVGAAAVQPDGQLIIGGSFTSIKGQPRNNIARLNNEGTLDMGFNPNVGGSVNSVLVQADGKILLGGSFTSVGGTGRNNIARLAADGTLDQGFNPNVNGFVSSLALQADGNILIGGSFTSVGGTDRSKIARVTADGTLDQGFNPNVNGFVSSMAVQADGKILLGGGFYTVGGAQRSNIARVTADGTLDPGFNPNADSQVSMLAVQADGKILLGGYFNTVGGIGRSAFARVNADGTLDPGFNPNANGAVYSVAVQADGKILLGGESNLVAGRSNFTRVTAGGTLDPSFNPNVEGGIISIIALQADGKILLGGDFTTVGGTGRDSFARLFNDPAAQSLGSQDITQALWTRGGSAPEVSQVTFELSTNGGTSYTPLPGTATRVDNTANWKLTGLSLPAVGQLRARGRTTDGSSSGLVEYVAAFPVAPNSLEIWRQTHFGTTANTSAAADTFDFDDDGLVNLIEYAFALNPTQNSAGQIPLPDVAAGTATYSFAQPAGVSGIVYRAEWSPTLLPGSWIAIPDTGTAPQHVFSVQAVGQTSIFTRLAVTAP